MDIFGMWLSVHSHSTVQPIALHVHWYKQRLSRSKAMLLLITCPKSQSKRNWMVEYCVDSDIGKELCSHWVANARLGKGKKTNPCSRESFDILSNPYAQTVWLQEILAK
jgi:hypothetical protein